MEIFSDDAIILQATVINERDFLLDLLCAAHGKLRAVAKYGATSQKKPIYQPLNHVQFQAKSRLYEQIPSIEAELHTPFFSLAINDSLALLIMQVASELCCCFLAEKEENINIYNDLHDLFHVCISPCDAHQMLAQYALFELKLLQNCGYGLQLYRCVATGTTENLHYISPKSGSAVCLNAGAPYHEKMFILPTFYLRTQPVTIDEIKNALEINRFFMFKHLVHECGRKLPKSRERLTQKISL